MASSLYVSGFLTQEHDNVGLYHQLSLRGSMDVGHPTVLRLVHQWRSADVIPHLSRDHGEAEEHCDGSPQVLVVQELQVVTPNVQEATDQSHQRDHGHSSRVVGWTENTDCDVGALGNEFSNGIRGKADAVDVHGISTLGLTLGREVHEDGGSVQTQQLEYLGALVEVHHGKEELVGVDRGEAI